MKIEEPATYRQVFEAIVDAPEVYELLQRIQKDVA